MQERVDEKNSPVQAGFSVPKKKFRKSVDRHKIRRQMVECWRLNKHKLYANVSPTQQYHIFLIFTDNVLPDYAIVEHAIIAGIEKLIKTTETRVD